ncbi:MAG: hypothetical protein Ct9H300mP23_01180 [Nitrospinota bacterium]|nr:MAG: hypothetical protein Ct9H300mP23_01180 [Nitrospinota bacterium]
MEQIFISGILPYDIYSLKLIEVARKINPNMSQQMLIQDNLVLTRSDPSGMGGTNLFIALKTMG